MVHRYRGQSTIEYLLASFWLVYLLIAMGVPEALIAAISNRLEKTQELLRLPVP